MIPIIELPLVSEDWVYPCSVDDARERLATVPEKDLRGLRRIFLAPATRKDHSANGRYWYSPAPLPCVRGTSCSALDGYRPAGFRAGDWQRRP